MSPRPNFDCHCGEAGVVIERHWKQPAMLCVHFAIGRKLWQRQIPHRLLVFETGGPMRSQHFVDDFAQSIVRRQRFFAI